MMPERMHGYVWGSMRTVRAESNTDSGADAPKRAASMNLVKEPCWGRRLASRRRPGRSSAGRVTDEPDVPQPGDGDLYARSSEVVG